MNVKQRASDMKGKGYKVHIITYCKIVYFQSEKTESRRTS